jgi:hypothetical protein
MAPKPRKWSNLEPVKFDGRKQRNARVAVADDGAKALYSYNTLVAFYDPATNVLLWSDENACSVTSVKHVNRWYNQIPARKRIAVQADIIELETAGLH